MIERSIELLRAQLAETAKRRAVEPLEVELGDPLSDAELASVEAQLGCSLDPRFVALFRSVNGFRVACGTRRAHVRPLRDLLGGPPDGVLAAANDSAILGGVSGAELAARARPLGRVTDLRDDYFHVIAVFANAANPDPVALMVDDYGVVAGDHRPVRARDLLWLLALQLDLAQIVSEGWFEAKGAGGDHPIVELDLHRWELHSALDHEVRGDYLSDVLLHLKGEVGLQGWEPTPVPVRWHEDRYEIEARADVVVRAVEASLPKHTVDVDYSRAIIELAPSLDIRIAFKLPKRIPKIGSKERSKRVNLADKSTTSLCVVWRSDVNADAVKRTRDRVAAVMATGFASATPASSTTSSRTKTSAAKSSAANKPAANKSAAKKAAANKGAAKKAAANKSKKKSSKAPAKTTKPGAKQAATPKQAANKKQLTSKGRRTR